MRRAARGAEGAAPASPGPGCRTVHWAHAAPRPSVRCGHRGGAAPLCTSCPSKTPPFSTVHPSPGSQKPLTCSQVFTRGLPLSQSKGPARVQRLTAPPLCSRGPAALPPLPARWAPALAPQAPDASPGAASTPAGLRTSAPLEARPDFLSRVGCSPLHWTCPQGDERASGTGGDSWVCLRPQGPA